MEQWVKIKELPDGYYISDWGQIKTDAGNVILGSWINRDGYYVFKLFNKLYYTHLLVLGNFEERPDWAQCGNHRNGIKGDNRLVNLEWSTHSLNRKHATENKLNLCERWRNPKHAKRYLEKWDNDKLLPRLHNPQ